MTNKIFYFSGTGNSLAIAKSLAAELGDTKLAPMATAVKEKLDLSGERIGLVFPVYAWGMPRMVAEFARKLRPESGQYVFAVTTCAGTPGKTLVQLRKILKSNGSDLHAGFAVSGDFMISVEGGNDLAIIKLVSWLGRKHVPGKASERLLQIARIVQEKQAHKPETSNASVNVVGSMMYGMSLKMFQTMDKGFAATDACIGCGTCVKVCPRENIVLADARPSWQHNCEMCNACMAWCPQGAISMNGAIPTAPTHHPEIALGDAVLR